MLLVKLVVCLSSCRRLADVIGEVGCLHVLMSSLMFLVNLVVRMFSQLRNTCLHVLMSSLVVLMKLDVCMT